MLSDHRDAGLEKKWPRMADENLPTNLLIFYYLVKKTPWIDFLVRFQLIKKERFHNLDNELATGQANIW